MFHFRAVVRNKAGLNRSSNKQHESEQAKQAAANRLSKKDRKKLKKKNKKIEKTQKKNLEQQTIRKLVSFDPKKVKIMNIREKEVRNTKWSAYTRLG